MRMRRDDLAEQSGFLGSRMAVVTVAVPVERRVVRSTRPSEAACRVLQCRAGRVSKYLISSPA